MSDSPKEPDSTADTDETLASTPVPDRMVGKYPIKQKLGKGAMGEVWLAHNPDLDIPVAIKTLPTYLLEKDPGFLKRFFQEAKTAARINHSNVVHVYDCGVDDDVHYIVMEYVDGGTVRQLQQKHDGNIPLEKAIDIVAAVAEALCEAARHNIIHRDIKPDNIMLDSRGIPKLADLGLAKQTESEDDTGMTGTGQAIGTPKYIAPEQVQDAKNVDGRADIYSLGVTFFHLVTGEAPFSASSSFEMMLKHVEEPLPDPKEKNPELPDDVCAVIRKMTEKSPDNRYQTPEELLQDLKAVRQRHAPDPTDMSIGGTTPVQKKDGDKKPRIKPGVIAAAMAILLVVLVTLAIRPWDRYKTDKPGNQEDPDKPAPVKESPPENGTVFAVKSIECDMVPVAAGSFKMGSGRGKDHEKPVHTVKITRPFWIGKYETTWKQFKAFADESKFRTDAEREESTHVYEDQGGGRYRWYQKDDVNWRNVAEGEDRAAVCLSWNDCMAFCKWLTEKEKAAGRLPAGYEYRLPTEAEWEYSCRAGTTTEYYFGEDSDGLNAHAWTINNTKSKVHRVGDTKPNAWGLYDMVGNAGEWCLDRADYKYRVITNTYVEGIEDPLCLVGKNRIYRGGSWVSSYIYCRSAARSAVDADHHAVMTGFRLVLGPMMTDREPPQGAAVKFGKSLKAATVEMDMVPIREGSFTMGSDTGKDHEKPRHKVIISKPFWMGKYEVTTKQFKAFADTTKFRTASEKAEGTMNYVPKYRKLWWRPNENWRTVNQDDNRAVVCISWQDAMAFCKWLTEMETGAGRVPLEYEYRLPTEAEWEYCCRAGYTQKYYWGDSDEKMSDYAWTSWNKHDKPRVIGDKKPNRWGLFDMVGNAHEYCLDAADYSEGVITTRTYRDEIKDPLNRSGKYRISRGGSWLSGSDEARSAYRDCSRVNYHSAVSGFRVVLAPRMSNRVPKE